MGRSVTEQRARPRQTGLALLLALSLGGCVSTPPPSSSLDDACLSATQRQTAACAEHRARTPLQVQRLPIDDATLYARLEEIKRWLADEKARLAGAPVSAAPTDDSTLIPDAPEALVPAARSSLDETLTAAIALADRGQNQQALALIRDYRALDQANLSAALIESRLLHQSGDSGQAEALLRQLLLGYPQVPELYNNLAVLQAARGDLGGAIETLQQAFATDPSFAKIQRNLKALYSVSASQALLQERQPARPRLEMIDQLSGP